MTHTLPRRPEYLLTVRERITPGSWYGMHSACRMVVRRLPQHHHRELNSIAHDEFRAALRAASPDLSPYTVMQYANRFNYALKVHRACCRTCLD